MDHVEGGSAADAAGVRLHDVLTHVGDTPVKSLPLSEIVALIRSARSPPDGTDPTTSTSTSISTSTTTPAVSLGFSRNVTDDRFAETLAQPLEQVVLAVQKPERGQSYGMRLEQDDAYGFAVVAEVAPTAFSRPTPAAVAVFRSDDIIVAFNSDRLQPDLPLNRFVNLLKAQPPSPR